MASLSTLQTINVDLLDVVMETLYANQDESGTRTAQCCVRLQGVDWNVPSDVSVFLKMHKPNHINIYQQIGADGFGSISGNVISFPITQSMTTVPGRVEISLEFIKGSNVLYSTMSYLRVLPIAFNHQVIEDTNEYLVLQEYVKDAEKYKDLSQSYAIGTGNTIRENDETDNSKYYHELAKQSETNAKASETASKKSETNAKQSETNAKASETNSTISENNAKTYMENASTSAITASSKADEALASANSASASENTINIKVVEINQKVNDVESIKSDVQNIASDVSDMRDAVSEDKTTIEDTIKNSLLASSEEILASVKDYYDRAQELYNSMYIDCDGETPQQRVVTIVSIDCSTPQSRLHDTNGILFNGGTPLNRQLAS